MLSSWVYKTFLDLLKESNMHKMARYCKVQQTQIEKEVWRVCSSTTSTTLPGLTRGKHAEAAKLTRWYQDSEIKHP